MAVHKGLFALNRWDAGQVEMNGKEEVGIWSREGNGGKIRRNRRCII